MLKKIPNGMYFNSDNAVRRHAEESLLKFLTKLNIKSAKYGKLVSFFSGKYMTLKINGQPVAVAQGVSCNVNAGIIPIDTDSNS